MHIKFNKDFRVFKKDDEIDFPVEPFKINWIVGDNRSALISTDTGKAGADSGI